ncbi:hypothetical protein POV27_17140 [Aureisphaera galaxeae]|uniref:hypothetical protein n=1 Tax=Aureisphaera galaxeae TaxID=1538023 RepID=UPI00234FE1E0|nr:hypothetical protein [Aureisphaera galaxeae]MDC8005781.1 hypothetical protein [Aureisphaera galaxeae]
MKKVLAVLTFALLICSQFAYGQMATEETSSTQYVTNRPIKAYPTVERISGSPYENQEFAIGNILKDGKILAGNIAIRYNALRDEIEVKRKIEDHNRTARVMTRSPEVYAKILNKLFVFVPNKEGLSASGYFLVLHEGEKYDLYKKITKEYVEGSESMSGLTRDIPAMYKEKEFYYLADKEAGTIKAFPKSRNGKFSLLGKKKKELKKYANENRLNVNKEYALVKLLKYYETL